MNAEDARPKTNKDQSPEAVEYTDCISAEA